MAIDILTQWINIYAMSLLGALILFGIGCAFAYALVYFKDHENDEW